MPRRAKPAADWELVRKDQQINKDGGDAATGGVVTSDAGGTAVPAQGFRDRDYPGTRTKAPKIDDTADSTQEISLPRKADDSLAAPTQPCACEDKAKCACLNEDKTKAIQENEDASANLDSPQMMLALYSPRETAEHIQQPNGVSPDDMHVTLGYYGRVGKDVAPEHLEGVHKAVEAAAKGYQPIKAKIGGVGRFNASTNSNGKDVLIAHVDSPDLHPMREHLIEQVRKCACANVEKSADGYKPQSFGDWMKEQTAPDMNGPKPKADHGYTPHITLAYIDPKDQMPIHKLDSREFTFTHLALCVGGKRTLFPLGEEKDVAKAIWCPIVKADDNAERLATGIVLQPEVVDAQGDIIGPDVIKQTAHNFLALYNKKTQLGLQHEVMKPQGVELVESWIAPVDMELNNRPILKGTWMLTVRVLNDDIWTGIITGRLNGFSIGGVAKVQRLLVA